MLKHQLITIAPPIRLCTDNGAMVAWAGVERFRLGMVDSLNVEPHPRWPLDELSPIQQSLNKRDSERLANNLKQNLFRRKQSIG